LIIVRAKPKSYDLPQSLAQTPNAPLAAPRVAEVSLGDMRRGASGVITIVRAHAPRSLDVEADELERRLLEMGFVEGARVKVLHEGFIRRDPICVRLDDMRVALRRHDARGVMVLPDTPA
jgi:ferrous iron transport protein A